jgi:hypothetical protein
MRPNTIALNLGKLMLLIMVVLSVYAMGSIAFPYLIPPFPTDIDFLAQKPDTLIGKRHYMIAFYTHISSSVFVLAAGLTQFSKTLMFRYPIWHRNIGKAYVFTVLLLSGPSGFIMAFYGSGGATAQWAFLLQALGWWYFTYMAYVTVLKKDLLRHGEYMLRSYAMAFSAITLRLATYLVSSYKFAFELRCADDANNMLCYPNFYITEAWLSWVLNLILVEILILTGLMRYYFPGLKNKPHG